MLTSQYNYASSERSGLAASIDGVADFRNLYHYNAAGQVDHVTQASQLGGNAVAEKEVDLDYAGGQLQALRRTQDGQSVADSEFTYDSLGRLTGLDVSGKANSKVEEDRLTNHHKRASRSPGWIRTTSVANHRVYDNHTNHHERVLLCMIPP